MSPIIDKEVFVGQSGDVIISMAEHLAHLSFLEYESLGDPEYRRLTSIPPAYQAMIIYNNSWNDFVSLWVLTQDLRIIFYNGFNREGTYLDLPLVSYLYVGIDLVAIKDTSNTLHVLDYGDVLIGSLSPEVIVQVENVKDISISANIDYREVIILFNDGSVATSYLDGINGLEYSDVPKINLISYPYAVSQGNTIYRLNRGHWNEVTSPESTITHMICLGLEDYLYTLDEDSQMILYSIDISDNFESVVLAADPDFTRLIETTDNSGTPGLVLVEDVGGNIYNDMDEERPSEERSRYPVKLMNLENLSKGKKTKSARNID